MRSDTDAGRSLLWLPVREGLYFDKPASNEPKFDVKLATEAYEPAFAPPFMVQIHFRESQINVSAHNLGTILLGEASSVINCQGYPALPPSANQFTVLGSNSPFHPPLLDQLSRKIGRACDESSNHEQHPVREDCPNNKRKRIGESQPIDGTRKSTPLGALCCPLHTPLSNRVMP